MITYNHKYRGSFEYEKFALNILSFHNAINSLETIEIQGTNEEIATLMSMSNDIDNIFNSFTGKNGICEQSFLLGLKERKCIKL